MSKKTTKSETIVIRLEPQLLEYIEKITDLRMGKSAVVRNMIREFYIHIPTDDAKKVFAGIKHFYI